MEITAQFKTLGYSVLDLTVVGRGCPDLLVSHNGVNILVEVKNKAGKNKVSIKQKGFAGKWQAKIYYVRDSEDVSKVHSELLNGTINSVNEK